MWSAGPGPGIGSGRGRPGQDPASPRLPSAQTDATRSHGTAAGGRRGSLFCGRRVAPVPPRGRTTGEDEESQDKRGHLSGLPQPRRTPPELVRGERAQCRGARDDAGAARQPEDTARSTVPEPHLWDAWPSPDDPSFDNWAAEFLRSMGLAVVAATDIASETSQAGKGEGGSASTPEEPRGADNQEADNEPPEQPAAVADNKVRLDDVMKVMKSAAAYIDGMRKATLSPGDAIRCAKDILEDCQSMRTRTAATLAEIDLATEIGKAVGRALRAAIEPQRDGTPPGTVIPLRHQAMAAAAAPLLASHVMTANRTSADWRQATRWHVAGGDLDAATHTLIDATQLATARAEIDVELVDDVWRGCLTNAEAAIASGKLADALGGYAGIVELINALADLAGRTKDLPLAREVCGLAIDAALLGDDLKRRQSAADILKRPEAVMAGSLTSAEPVPAKDEPSAGTPIGRLRETVQAMAQTLGDRALMAESSLLEATNFRSRLGAAQRVAAARRVAETLGDSKLGTRARQVAVRASEVWLEEAIEAARREDGRGADGGAWESAEFVGLGAREMGTVASDDRIQELIGELLGKLLVLSRSAGQDIAVGRKALRIIYRLAEGLGTDFIAQGPAVHLIGAFLEQAGRIPNTKSHEALNLGEREWGVIETVWKAIAADKTLADPLSKQARGFYRTLVDRADFSESRLHLAEADACFNQAQALARIFGFETPVPPNQRLLPLWRRVRHAVEDFLS
jgi:hypothetical protein